MFFLKLVWDKWKFIAHKIGLFQSKVILTVFYFTLLLPIGIVFTIFKDVLQIKSKRKSTWMTNIHQTNSLEMMRKQS